MRWCAGFFCILWCAIGLPVLADQPAPGGRTLTVASTDNFAPINLLDARGRLTGFGVELSDAVLAAIDVEVRRLHAPSWLRVVDWLETGAADLIHDTGYTRERDAFMDFTQPILEVPEVIFVRQEQLTIRDLASLRGRAVACVRGHIGHLHLQSIPGMHCVLVETPVAGLYALVSGEVEAFVYPQQIVEYYAQTLRLTDKIKIVGEPLRTLRYAMTVAEGDAALLAELNRGIDQVKASGEYARIYAKWFGRKLLSGYTRRQVVVLVVAALLMGLLLSTVLVLSVDNLRVRRARRALRQSEQRFKIAGELAYDLIYEWRVDADRITWLGDLDAALGHAQGAIAPTVQGWLALIHPDDAEGVARILARRRTAGEPVRTDYRIRRRDGSYRHWTDQGRALTDEAGRFQKWIGVCKDVTAEVQQQRRLERVAHYDTLTDLPNRVLLAERLTGAMAHARRRGRQVALVYLDLDGFKAINDSFGHAVGDRFLAALAKDLRQATRGSDTIARLGGDEFVAVLRDVAAPADCEPLLRRLLRAAAQPVAVDEYRLRVTASLGVTFYPQLEEVDADQLLRQADQAMYEAKLAGRNRFHFFDTARDRSQRGWHAQLERIGAALDTGELVVHFQPKVDMRSGALIGAEALVRWQHPQRGLLQPRDFLPVIERHPLVVRLGEWVIETVLRQMADWRAAGLDIPVSVNVAARQLLDESFVGSLEALLAAHPGVAPERLELELLETSALEDIGQVSQVMRDCNRIGISFALDDFGTGYSSLTYLKHLPVATVKVDQSFVRGVLDDPADLAILEGVLRISAGLGRDVIAEGVETLAHGALLLRLGCTLAQGFGIAAPMPAADLPAWIARWRPDPSWRTQRRVAQDDLPLLYACTEQRAWVRALQQYLRSGGAETLPPVPGEGRLGHWLRGAGAAQYGGRPGFPALVSRHDALRQTGRRLCGLRADGRGQAALDGLPALLAMSDEVLRGLEALMAEADALV